jgi:nitroreductase
MLADLIKANRSCRRFDQNQPVFLDTLKALVELARLSASAANLQPLKYILSCNREKNAAIFDCLAWAAYLKNWPGPAEGERPAAYVIILGDTSITKNFGCDHGIAAQSILLGAREKGLSGCMIGSIKRKQMAALFDLPTGLEILLTLAIGNPLEQVVIEPVGPDNSIRYWRDDAAVHHVPKRSLDEIIYDACP